MSFSTFATADGGGRITLPFQLNPRQIDDIPDINKLNVQHLQITQDNAPWTGYYARVGYGSTKVAVELYEGVWFELRFEPAHNKTFAIRVARPSLQLINTPTSNMNIEELKHQTAAQGTPVQGQGTLPAPTGFTTAPTTPAVRIPPAESRPPSPRSEGSNIFGFGTRFGRDDNTPRQSGRAPREPSPPPPDDDPNSGLDDEERTRQFLKSIQGSRLEGQAPAPFKGDRSDTKRFLLAFGRYSFMNHTAEMIRDPMKRAALFLGFMDGKALSWAN